MERDDVYPVLPYCSPGTTKRRCHATQGQNSQWSPDAHTRATDFCWRPARFRIVCILLLSTPRS